MLQKQAILVRIIGNFIQANYSTKEVKQDCRQVTNKTDPPGAKLSSTIYIPFVNIYACAKPQGQ